MKYFKVMALAFAGMMSTGAAYAQDEVEATVGADVVSTYVWRGNKLDASAIQPSASVSYKGVSLSGWGSYSTSTNSPFEEFDLTLSYTAGNFNIGVTDYWNNGFADKRYLRYGSGEATTSHTFEANIGYDFGVASVQWYTNIAGIDAVKENGKRAYTSYVEVNAPFKLGGLDWNATVGAIPYAADRGFYADNGEGYSSSFAVTNVALKATKDIKVTDSFSVPVFAAVNANPASQNTYFVFGFTLKP